MLAQTKNFQQRWTFIRDLAQKAAQGDARSLGELKRLEQGDAYERYWSLNACFFHEDWKVAALMLNDPVRKIRTHAVALCCRYAPGEELIRMMKASPQHAAQLYLVHLKRRKRQDIIDGYVQESGLLTRNQVQALPQGMAAFASIELHHANWPVLRFALGATFWRRMAALDSSEITRLLHDDILSQVWNRQAADKVIWILEKLAKFSIVKTADLLESIQQSPLIWIWLEHIPRTLLRRCWTYAPDRLLLPLIRRADLGDRSVLKWVFGQGSLDKIVGKLHADIIRWVLQHAPQSLSDHGPAARQWLRGLSAEKKLEIWEIHRQVGDPAWGGHLLGIMEARMEDKELIYQRWSLARRHHDGTIPLNALASLPQPFREKEAMRHLNAVASLKEKESSRLVYAALLPFEKALEHVLTYWHNPDGEKRATAWSILVRTCYFHPEDLPKVFDHILKKKNEQDPVRRSILSELVELSARSLKLIPTSAFQELIQSQIQVSDISHQSVCLLGKLLNRIYIWEPEWAVAQWMELLKIHPMVAPILSPLAQSLDETKIEAFFEHFAPLFKSWQATARYDYILSVLQVKTRHPCRLPFILNTLEKIVEDGASLFWCDKALTYLRSCDQDRFERFVREIQSIDESILLCPAVESWVARHDDDGLDRLLDPAPLLGNWAQEKKKIIPILNTPYHRWTATQHVAYERLLRNLLEPERPLAEARVYFHIAPRLFFQSHAGLKATLQDPRPLIRELGIRGLGRTFDFSVLPDLLSEVEGEGARFAILAVRSLLRERKPAETVTLLEQIPFRGVSVAKEVCRLLGDLGGTEAVPLLLKRGREAQHQDVLIAVVRSLWDHLDDSAVWDFFFDTAQNGPAQAVGHLASLPQMTATPEMDAKFSKLAGFLLKRSEVPVRLDVIDRLRTSPVVDNNRALMKLLLSMIPKSTRTERERLQDLIIMRMKPGEENAVAQALIQSFTDARITARGLRALSSFVRQVPQDSVIHLGRLLLERYRADPVHTPDIVALGRACGLTPDFWYQLASEGLLDEDSLSELIIWLDEHAGSQSEEARLRQSTDRFLRRLGLVALQRAVGRYGWTTSNRETLEVYQADANPYVRRPALMIAPENEGS
jgi:hypothetical protein